MTTHVAHDVVNYALATGKDALKYSKSQPGVIKWTVEKVESPVCAVLESKIGQTAIKVGDRAICVADGTIDKAMNTGAYKSTSRIVKSTYSNRVEPVIKNRIVPASKAVQKTITSTTTAVTAPVANVYKRTLHFADRTVEYALPEADAKLAKEDNALPKSVMGLSKKITRRSVRKVAATRKMVVATAAYTFEQSKPANLKKNTVIVYNKALAGADKLVDNYLPEKDGLTGKTPVMLVKKFAKRSKTHTIATIKKFATAVKNSPATFKKACANTYKMLTEQAMKLRNLKLKVKLMTIGDMKAHVTPLLNSMQTKGVMYVTAADKMLLKFQYTAALRNFGVNFYTNKLAHIVNPMLTKLIGDGKAAPTKAIKPTATRPAPVPTPLPAPEPEPVMAEEEPMVEKAEKKKKKNNKKTKEIEQEGTVGADDEDGAM